ncbi:MAG TPA: zf-HC2 domain-containing protein [Thermoclostridium sp.]|mgnify:FL=1|nr:zf-HC2 domain-containing protein [Clostridiaceae bacterium]HOQ74960.1 zf-HC2 domain-containing protein [Thermoclostridium sp.]HPU45521.1 zf-HC2 domain-containing protein [Thermoclostridium sp.]
MGCEKAWELMMSRLDGELGKRDSMILENHLRICPECRRQMAALDAALLELEMSGPAAPESIEQNVMKKICGARNKETASLLPYVVLPAALLTGALAFILYEFRTAGMMDLIVKAARAIELFYRVFESMTGVLRLLLNNPYTGVIMMITGILLFAGIIVLISVQFWKKGNSSVYWRTTK